MEAIGIQLIIEIDNTQEIKLAVVETLLVLNLI